MSDFELLAKLKGNTRTFAVHSNKNPYAAVAAMAIAMAKSQEDGPYFRFSEKVQLPIQTEDEGKIASNSAAGQVDVDCKNDWARFLRRIGLPDCGLKFDETRTVEENTMRFLNAHNRRIPLPRPRIVYESRELSIPDDYLQDYASLRSLIETGGDLTPYLSRDIAKKGKADKNDPLLNGWGIQHLHFRANGTGYILFCKITDDEIFVVQALPHKDAWIDTQLLEILHSNWPEQSASGRPNGLIPENVLADDRSRLRDLNANFLTTVSDGTVYMAPGGGTMASGDSINDRTNCDKLFGELQTWQDTLKQNSENIRNALRWPDNEGLTVRMAFDNRECCFYEPTRRLILSLTAAV